MRPGALCAHAVPYADNVCSSLQLFGVCTCIVWTCNRVNAKIVSDVVCFVTVCLHAITENECPTASLQGVNRDISGHEPPGDPFPP